MRHHQRGLLVGGPEVDQGLLQFVSCQRIEHSEWLIQQQHLRVESEGPRESDALTHPGRQFGRSFLECITEANQFEIVDDNVGALLARQVRIDLFDPEHHVVERAAPRKQ